MEKLNRIKIILVEKENAGRGLVQQLEKSTCIVDKWTRNTSIGSTFLNSMVKQLEVDMKDLLIQIIKSNYDKSKTFYQVGRR